MDDAQQLVLGLILATTCFGIMYWVMLKRPNDKWGIFLSFMIGVMGALAFISPPISHWIASGINVPTEWTIDLRIRNLLLGATAYIVPNASVILGSFCLLATLERVAKSKCAAIDGVSQGSQVTSTNQLNLTDNEVVVSA